MDNSTGMSGGLLSGMVDLDSSVPHHSFLHVQPMPATGLDLDHPMPLFGPAAPSLNPPSHGKGIYPYATHINDDGHLAAAEGNGHGQQSVLAAAGADLGKKGFPWQRMKWAHDVVRQLIRIVAYVEDHEGAQEAGDATKRKHGVAFQKKGKWRIVSLLMQENGACVSPQQCEDKFNDLNKRYKRLIDILGPAASFIVVNDPASLESMPISQQAKSDVKRILNSKHLFYEEMSAYHAGQKIPDFPDVNLQSCLLPTVAPSKVGNQYCVDGQEEKEKEEDGDEGDEEEGIRSKDIGRRVFESFLADVDAVLRDPKRPLSERQEWLKKRELQLKEKRLEINIEALAIERQLFKWQRFSRKKDREIEKLKLDVERLMLENEQMTMQMRQKELELYYKRSRSILVGGRARMGADEAWKGPLRFCPCD